MSSLSRYGGDVYGCIAAQATWNQADDDDTDPDPSNSCWWAFDGECDEPGIGTGVCDAGTDATDCASAVTAPTIDLPDDVEERDQTLSECDAWSASNSGGVEGTIDTWDISTIPSGAVFDLRVTVIGGESGTAWDYQVRCRTP